MNWSAKRDNPDRLPRRVVMTQGNVISKLGNERVHHFREDGSEINLADTGNNRNRRLEKMPRKTGTRRGDWGTRVRIVNGVNPKSISRHGYMALQVNRTNRELRQQQLAAYRDGEARKVWPIVG